MLIQFEHSRPVSKVAGSKGDEMQKKDTHLCLLQQPASQPRIVLDELVIAQAVLHRRG